MPMDDSMDTKLEEVETTLAPRTGYKLYDMLKPSEIDLEGRVVLDVGTSTGGFSDACLQDKTHLVYAVDAGRDRLLGRLRSDPRAINMESVDCRYLNGDVSDPYPDFVRIDIPFTSTRQVLPVLAKQSANMEAIALIEPQSEADKTKVGKYGIVKNERIHIEALQSMCNHVRTLGLYVHYLCTSSVLGRDGNKEPVMYLKYIQTHKVLSTRGIVKNCTVKGWECVHTDLCKEFHPDGQGAAGAI